MQANCPKCSHNIVVDDAKAPDGPFNVRCPKCQNPVRFAGKATSQEAPAAAPAAPPAPAAGPTTSTPAPANGSAVPPGPPVAKDGEKALVALPDREQAGAVTLCLNRLGYAVETLQDIEDGARLLEQGVFSVVATNRAVAQPGHGETLYQRLMRMSPEARRRILLVLIGPEFQTGEGTQAYAVLADLVVSAAEAGNMDHVFRGVHGERTRLYQAFNDAVRRYENSN